MFQHWLLITAAFSAAEPHRAPAIEIERNLMTQHQCYAAIQALEAQTVERQRLLPDWRHYAICVPLEDLRDRLRQFELLYPSLRINP